MVEGLQIPLPMFSCAGEESAYIPRSQKQLISSHLPLLLFKRHGRSEELLPLKYEGSVRDVDLTSVDCSAFKKALSNPAQQLVVVLDNKERPGQGRARQGKAKKAQDIE